MLAICRLVDIHEELPGVYAIEYISTLWEEWDFLIHSSCMFFNRTIAVKNVYFREV